MSICFYICISVCMFFEDISQLKAISEVKVSPKESFLPDTLLRLSDLLVRSLTNAWRVILGPID